MNRDLLIERAGPHLALLSEVSGDSAYLSCIDNGRVLYLAEVKCVNSSRRKRWLGAYVPIEGTAVGAALRGALEDGGYATCSGNTTERGASGAAAPVRGPGGEICCALSIIVPSASVDLGALHALGDLAATEAASFSERLRKNAEA